ncbi:hypothetical protein Tco_0524662 [Tanacetum coccineum]
MVYVVNSVLASGVDIIVKEDFVCFRFKETEISSIYDPKSELFQMIPPKHFQHHPLQPQYESYSCELCGNDAHYDYDCPPRVPLVYEHEPGYDNYYPQNSPSFPQQYLCYENCGGPQESFHHVGDPRANDDDEDNDDDNDDEESTILLNEVISQIPPSIAITPILRTMEPEDSLIMRSEHLSTIPEKESDEFIKSSIEDLIPIPNIESEDSYVSKLDEPVLLVTPLSKVNEDECFDPGGDFILEEIEACLTSDSIPSEIDNDDFDPEGDILLLKKLLNNDPSSPLPLINIIPNLLPEMFFDHDPKSLEMKPDKDDSEGIYV